MRLRVAHLRGEGAAAWDKETIFLAYQQGFVKESGDEIRRAAAGHEN